MSEKEEAMFRYIEKIFKGYYEKAAKSPFVRKPFSWALYQTWKEIDAKEIVREI